MVLVDEFPTWEAARSAAPTSVVYPGGTKQSFFQQQMSRRVIGLNPQQMSSGRRPTRSRADG